MSYKTPPIFIIGATGYIGGRLVARLLEQGYHIRAAGRNLLKLNDRPWADHPNVHLVEVNAFNQLALINAVEGCSMAYFLIPLPANIEKESIGSNNRILANIADLAKNTKLKQVIILQDFDQQTTNQSPKELQKFKKNSLFYNLPITLIQTTTIIGSGSTSFEILRYLTDNVRLLPTPRWARIPCQPISITNVVDYLIQCLRIPETIGKILNICGPDTVTYQQMMRIYAEEVDLSKRWLIPIPFYLSGLSVYWIHLMTPVPIRFARLLVNHLKQPRICFNELTRQLIPLDLWSCRKVFRKATDRVFENRVETHWTDSGRIPSVERALEDESAWGDDKLYKDQRQLIINATQEDVWQSVVRIGGSTGWYYGNWLWKLRGFLDRLVGGVGALRGRRHPSELRLGDALDVWRVKVLDPPYQLMLVAEMKLPGQAILDFHLEMMNSGKTQLKQTALFLAKGIPGFLYWYSVLPFHAFIFEGMLQGLAKATRLSHRYPFQVKAVLKIGANLEEIHLINLSQGGCKILKSSRIPPNPTLTLILYSPPTVEVSVQVIGDYRSRDGFHYSLKFLVMNTFFNNWLNQTIQDLKQTTEGGES
jgi:uncharacterized protein YbjT (DUF2867 family)